MNQPIDQQEGAIPQVVSHREENPRDGRAVSMYNGGLQ